MLASVIMAAALGLPGGALGATVYDDIPSPQPGNVPSIAYEANGIAEFGGQIQLAGTERQHPTVTVLMSSWGCQSGHWTSNDCVTTPGATFSHLITLNLYNVGVGGAVGSLIATASQTFNIPFRPSHDPTNCPLTPEKWFSAADGLCYNGFATPISFTLNTVTLPNKVIVSDAYNTTDYGYAPIGATACSGTHAGCGYDSLNVGTDGAPPSTGSQPQPTDAYLNSVFGSNYCDGGAGGSNVFRLDAGCWAGFQPAFRVAAVTINPPPNKDACKNNGWQTFTRADGSKFKNQGDCIQYVNTGK
jgi:hypothetical protein